MCTVFTAYIFYIYLFIKSIFLFNLTSNSCTPCTKLSEPLLQLGYSDLQFVHKSCTNRAQNPQFVHKLRPALINEVGRPLFVYWSRTVVRGFLILNEGVRQMINVTKTSQLTGKKHTMQLPLTPEQAEDGLYKMREGMYVQDAFPMLDEDQREFIATGITREEWETLGGDDE